MLAAGSWVLLYGAKVGEGWLYGDPVFLPDVYGWPGALVLGFGILIIFYIILVFVEVKTRIGDTYGRPEEAITVKKIKEIVRTSQVFCLIHKKEDMPQRLDVIAIELNSQYMVKSLKHIENITG